MKANHKKPINASDNGRSAKRDLPFRIFDFVVIGLVAVVSLLSLLFINGSRSDTVIIRWNGKELYRGNIDQDMVVTTPDGRNTIVIWDGKVHMEEADCNDQICVKSGISTPSKPIVCLPNGVIVTITGSEEADTVTW